jgi:preprotein translocase subunit SecG
MDIGTVLVVILAVLFFGGIWFLSYASKRHNASKPDKSTSKGK